MFWTFHFLYRASFLQLTKAWHNCSAEQPMPLTKGWNKIINNRPHFVSQKKTYQQKEVRASTSNYNDTFSFTSPVQLQKLPPLSNGLRTIVYEQTSLWWSPSPYLEWYNSEKSKICARYQILQLWSSEVFHVGLPKKKKSFMFFLSSNFLCIST